MTQTSTAAALQPNRARGLLRASFARAGTRTHAARVREAGGLRLRFPKVVAGVGPDCEAVCINTGGGMMGGDAATYDFTCEAGAAATLTSQSAEKMYRAEGEATTVDVTLRLEPGATLEWLPQETILFDRVRLARRLTVDMAADATLLLAEMLVFGRLAMGETVTQGFLHDRWRLKRDGELVYAEELRLDGPISDILARPALGGGARALATLILVAPGVESRIEPVRGVLAESAAEGGASAWNGLLAVRLASPSPERVRATIVTLLTLLRGRAVPRVWQ
jgi:urease accessory protein